MKEKGWGNSLKNEIVVADGFMQQFDFSKDVNAYTKVSLEMITPDPIIFPKGKLNRCKIVFYEDDLKDTPAIEHIHGGNGWDWPKAKKEKQNFNRYVRRKKKKEKKEPCQYRMIRL